MRLQVTVGVQEPEKLNTVELAQKLPRGAANVTAVKGGQNVPNPDGDTIVIATAAVEAFLPSQADNWKQA